MRPTLLSVLCGTALLILSAPTAARAQDAEPADDQPRREELKIALDMRGDFHFTGYDDAANSSGFSGEFLNILLDGTINDRLSYHFRHRLNKFADAKSNVFNATDWIYLAWRAAERTTVSAGKMVVGIGGYEYDRAPIDVYFYSGYCSNISCYQFGLSVSQTSRSGNHTLTAQICNSPFGQVGDGLYAYNLLWSGRMGVYSTLWSANMLEYADGRYIAYLALGNAIETGPFRLELDFMNRASKHQAFWFKDMSIVGEASCFVHERVKAIVKAGYDVNKTDYYSAVGDQMIAPDLCVAPGTDRAFYGLGVEYYPLKGSRNLRLHAAWADTYDADGQAMNFLSIGLRWRVDLYNRR